MECPKCKTVNGDAETFCRRCHATVLFRCPSCAATQRHGGKCGKCGIDFAKYAFMLMAQEKTRITSEREKAVEKAAIWKQIILLPITGGYSLIRFFLSRDRA